MSNAGLTEILSIVTSVVSITLGLVAIALSVYYYRVARDTEKQVGCSLTKIETQTQTLQAITGSQLDKLTSYVTEHRPSQTDEVIPQLLDALTRMPGSVLQAAQAAEEGPSEQDVQRVRVSHLIAIHFYAAVANYWAQWYLPALSQFDESQQLHSLAKRVVDDSANDFEWASSQLSNCDQASVESSSAAAYYTETKGSWQQHVKNSTEVWQAKP